MMGFLPQDDVRLQVEVLVHPIYPLGAYCTLNSSNWSSFLFNLYSFPQLLELDQDVESGV